MTDCCRMTAAQRSAAFRLLRDFLGEDAHYLASSAAYGDGGKAALHGALDLFLERPELGFIWLAYDGEEAVAACVICFAISTLLGALVAKLDDVCVAPGRQGQGIGSTLLASLKAELRTHGVRRIDTSCHLDNDAARRFYERHGFQPLHEERLACLL